MKMGSEPTIMTRTERHPMLLRTAPWPRGREERVLEMALGVAVGERERLSAAP
jgi:hypothetical protein